MGGFELKLDKQNMLSGASGIISGAVGNNPFAGAIEEIIKGGNVCDVAAKFGQTVAEGAAREAFGLFGAGISAAAEETKAKIKAAKIAKATAKAEETASEGAAKTETIVTNLTSEINLIDADYKHAQAELEKHQELLGGQAEKFEETSKLIQEQIKTYNEKQAKKAELEKKLENAPEEDKKGIEAEIKGLNAELATYTQSIGTLKEAVKNFANSIYNAVIQAEATQKLAQKAQANLGTIVETGNEEVNQVVNNTLEQTETQATEAAATSSELYSDGQRCVATAKNAQVTSSFLSFIPGIGGAVNGFNQGQLFQLLTIGQNSIGTSENAFDNIGEVGHTFNTYVQNTNNQYANANTTLQGAFKGIGSVVTISQEIIDFGTERLDNAGVEFKPEEKKKEVEA